MAQRLGLVVEVGEFVGSNSGHADLLKFQAPTTSDPS